MPHASNPSGCFAFAPTGVAGIGTRPTTGGRDTEHASAGMSEQTLRLAA